MSLSIEAILKLMQGFYYYGKVTAIPGANQFTIPELAGLGAGKFAGATSPYHAFVMRDDGGAGAAPQGEHQAVTAYNTATGGFTTVAFTVAVAVGDEIMIVHPALIGVLTIITSTGRQLFSMDFWSDPVEEEQLAAAAGTIALADVTVADLPAGATVVRAIAMFKFRMIENTNAAANKLNGATVAATSQVIQVDDSAVTGFVDAINFVDDQFGLAGSTRESGDVCIGSVDIAARVNANDTYSFRWLLGRADLDFLNFNDVQTGLRIWYSV